MADGGIEESRMAEMSGFIQRKALNRGGLPEEEEVDEEEDRDEYDDDMTVSGQQNKAGFEEYDPQ